MKPNEGYIKLIINPYSGASSSKLMVRKFAAYLVEQKFDVHTELTQSLLHAQEIATMAAVDYNCKLIAVAGGDGTVREVAHGMEGSDKPMMILPSGTENLLANELGYNEKASTLIKTFDNETIKLLDLGNCNGRSFTSVAGAGFDGDIVHMVNSLRKGHITHTEYIEPIIRTLHKHKFPNLTIEVDGEELFSGQCLVIFGNISRYAVGLPILYAADYSDGLLDVCIYKCSSRTKLLKHSLMTVLKSHYKFKDVIYAQFKNMKITSNEPVKTELDGDPGPELPLDVSVVPQAVKVLVPPDAKPAGIRTRLARILH